MRFSKGATGRNLLPPQIFKVVDELLRKIVVDTNNNEACRRYHFSETSSFISKKVLLGYKPHPDYETTYSMSPIKGRLIMLRNSFPTTSFYQPVEYLLPVALLGRTLDTNTCKEHNKRLVKFTYNSTCLRPKWN